MLEIMLPRKIDVSKKFVAASKRISDLRQWNRFRTDSFLFEVYLIKRKIVQKPLNWRHDFIYNGMKIDVKHIETNFNIQNNKSTQYIESITTGELTHFLFYQSNLNIESVLMPGDVVSIEPIALCDARKIIKSRLPSNFDNTEAYVPMDTIETLKENA